MTFSNNSSSPPPPPPPPSSPSPPPPPSAASTTTTTTTKKKQPNPNSLRFIKEEKKAKLKLDNDNNNNNENNNSNIKKDQTRFGVRGVRLRRYEEVVADLLYPPPTSPNPTQPLAAAENNETKGVRPFYLSLPSLPNDKRRKMIESSLLLLPNNNNNNNKEEEEEESKKEKEKEEKKQFPSQQQPPPPPWPFDVLPNAACVRDDPTTPASLKEENKKKKKKKRIRNTTGKLSGARALKKEQQLSSLLRCVFAMIPSSHFGPLSSEQQQETSTTSKDDKDDDNDEMSKKRLTIVDFAGGTGSLAIPLAVLLPKCNVVIVDLKKQSLDIVHEKVKGLTIPPQSSLSSSSLSSSLSSLSVPQNKEDELNINHSDENNNNNSNNNNQTNDPRTTITNKTTTTTNHANTHQSCAPHLPNLYTYHGSISSYNNNASHNTFHIALSLHACGEASDLVLHQCLRHHHHHNNPPAFIISPCCVGKLNTYKFNPYIYQATSTNDALITYPQSNYYKKTLNTNVEEYNVLAKAADYSEVSDLRCSKNAVRRVAKTLIEWDRLMFVQEEMSSRRRKETKEQKQKQNNKEGYCYEVALTRMIPWECSPKNDILLGWMNNNNSSSCSSYGCDDDDDDDDDDTNNNIILQSPYGNVHGNDYPKCKDCDADIQATLCHLFSATAATDDDDDNNDGGGGGGSGQKQSKDQQQQQLKHDQVDWTKEEEEEIRQHLLLFVNEDETLYNNNNNNTTTRTTTKNNATTTTTTTTTLLGTIEINETTKEPTGRIVYELPKGMGKRKRKIAHYVSQQLGLSHWCHGKKMADKIVIVAKKQKGKKNEHNNKQPQQK